MILVLRDLGLGDLATVVPVLRGLRAALPAEPIAVAARAGLAPLIDLIGAGLTTGRPDGVRPDIAINLHGRGPESHRRLQNTEPGKLWAFANPAAGHLDGPLWNEDEHEVARWARLVDHYGVPVDPADLGLAVPDREVSRGVTIIHPGAKSPTRRWPPARFAAVARRLAADGHRVLVTASSDEHELAVRVARAAGLDATAVPATDLAELAALVAHARLVISGDTGIAHLATAYATPSVTLFGPMSPQRWGPPDRPCHRPLWHGTRSEPGDRPGPVHPALLAIDEDEVLAAVTDLAGR